MQTLEPLLVSGKACDYIKVTRPWDEQVMARIGVVDSDTALTALANADKIFCDKKAWLPRAQRIEILEKVCSLLQARKDELAIQAAAEGGKPLIDSKIELDRAVVSLQSCADYLRSSEADGRRITMDINAASREHIAFTIKEPCGVVIAFSAFNHPINLIAHQIGPAIASGCPVIIKPAAVTPLSCFALVELFYEAGLPPIYCQALLTKDHETSYQLVSDPRMSFFSFIGSAKVGWALRAKLPAGAGCALEHGGAAPVIIMDDADLDDNLPRLAKGGFYHAGQVCVSVQRVYAHSSIADKVANRLAELGLAMKIGDPTAADTEVGPLIKRSEVDRVDAWVQSAIDDGAQLISGGKRFSDTAYECTVLLNPSDRAQVSCEELFGPVICVYAFDDIDDALQRANALPFAFQAAVITRSMDNAWYCAKNLNATAVMINEHTAFRVDWMPFAGRKLSGYGTGGIPYTIEDMQLEKMLVIRSQYL
ncbi:MAG: aldehyde dehydrogenase family protein [Chromatiales bacterium]|nr:aldehyde dehydrogenase family protein [Chromatiales bacterium]